jgi:hypoxia induced protein
MPAAYKSVIIAALIAVAAVLALGLLNMAVGGSASRSQTLMRWRIALQFLAIIIIMAAIYFVSA